MDPSSHLAPNDVFLWYTSSMSDIPPQNETKRTTLIIHWIWLMDKTHTFLCNVHKNIFQFFSLFLHAGQFILLTCPTFWNIIHSEFLFEHYYLYGILFNGYISMYSLGGAHLNRGMVQYHLSTKIYAICFYLYVHLWFLYFISLISVSNSPLCIRNHWSLPGENLWNFFPDLLRFSIQSVIFFLLFS